MAIRVLGHANSTISEVETNTGALRVVPAAPDVVASVSVSHAVLGTVGSAAASNSVVGVYRWESEATVASVQKVLVGISESGTGTAGVYRVEVYRATGMFYLPRNASSDTEVRWSGQNTMRTQHTSPGSGIAADVTTQRSSNFQIYAGNGTVSGFPDAGTFRLDANPIGTITYSRRATAGFATFPTAPVWDPIEPHSLVLGFLDAVVIRATSAAGLIGTTRLDVTIKFDELKNPPF